MNDVLETPVLNVQLIAVIYRLAGVMRRGAGAGANAAGLAVVMGPMAQCVLGKDIIKRFFDWRKYLENKMATLNLLLTL